MKSVSPEIQVLAEYLSTQEITHTPMGDPNDPVCCIGSHEFYYGHGWVVHEGYAGLRWCPKGAEERVPDGPLRDHLETTYPVFADK